MTWRDADEHACSRKGGDRGQSEVIGTVVLIGIVVAGLTVTGVLVLGTFADVTASNEPRLALEPRVNATALTLVHGGGEPVRTDRLQVVLRGDGEEVSYTVDESVVEGNANGLLEPGERSTKAHGLGSGPVDVVVVDTGANRVVLNVEVRIP